MTRRAELLVSGVAIGIALLFAVAVFVWRVPFEDAPWSLPAFPRMEGRAAFGIYPWLQWFSVLAVAIVFIIPAIRRDARRSAAYLAGIVSFATAVVYLPLWFVRSSRIDRLRGRIDEPIPTFRILVAAAICILFLTVGCIAVARLRRAPPITLHAALVTAAIVNAGLLHLFWVPRMEPTQWMPIEKDRWDLLMPVRPCRGAIVWAFENRGFEEIGTIDDIWLRFADPRNGHTAVFAVSVEGRWRAEYYWLNSSDLHPLRVHRDDPAVMDCDSRARSEPVAPAEWHKLGFSW